MSGDDVGCAVVCAEVEEWYLPLLELRHEPRLLHTCVRGVGDVVRLDYQGLAPLLPDHLHRRLDYGEVGEDHALRVLRVADVWLDDYLHPGLDL